MFEPILTGKPIKANGADPVQMPHHVASDLGLRCLLQDFASKIE